MKRRTLLGSLGLAASGAAVLGTGAFTRTAVDRDFDLTISGDANALLTLAPNDDSTAASGGIATFDGPGNLTTNDSASDLVVDAGGTIALDITDGTLGGGGINTEAMFVSTDLIRAENRSGHDFAVDVTNAPTGFDLLAYGGDAGGAVSLVNNDYPVELTTGQVAGVTVLVDTTVTGLGTLQGDVRIRADSNQTPNKPTSPDFQLSNL